MSGLFYCRKSMSEPPFDWNNPATWISGGLLTLYSLVRILKRDNRNDKQEKAVDQAVNQVIATLRAEVERLTKRIETMEHEIVELHTERANFHKERLRFEEERIALLAQLRQCQEAHGQTGLF